MLEFQLLFNIILLDMGIKFLLVKITPSMYLKCLCLLQICSSRYFSQEIISGVSIYLQLLRRDVACNVGRLSGREVDTLAYNLQMFECSMKGYEWN